MPTGTPRTWAAGDGLTAALANAEFRDQFIALYGVPRGRLKRTSNGGITVASQTVGTLHTTVLPANLMKFNIAVYNAYTGAMVTGSTPWSRLIAPIDGIYDASGMLAFQGFQTGAVCAVLRQNATTIIDAEVMAGPGLNNTQIVGASGISSTTGDMTPSVGTEIKMVAGDFIEIYGTCNNAVGGDSIWGDSILSLEWKGTLA